ncbi:hypothetical protein CRG98_045431 [Punica granatum]|uniref:Uncharacterized protein n=1 Tax=Punica granatum TaxID=22663 RepID=A0A2I0HR34_PUNGR|nr:hypothetical protein CRG98_045431 [Punica granatum]
MVFEGFEPIFGEPKVEWANRGPLPLRRFVYYVHSPDPSHLRIHVSDFHTNTWEAVRSVHQLEDMIFLWCNVYIGSQGTSISVEDSICLCMFLIYLMLDTFFRQKRDDIGVGDSWSEFIDYFQSSIKSDNVKLVLEGQSGSGAAQAKLVAQKSKGMPLIFIPLMKLMDSDAAEAIGNLSLELLAAFKTTQLLLTQGKHKDAATKATNRVVPTHRRARVRGAILQESEDDREG